MIRRPRPPPALAALALGLAACSPAAFRLGPVGDASAALSPLGAPPRASLALAAPVDARPAIERAGRQAPRPNGRDRGAAGDELAAEAPGTDAARELAAALRTTLDRARVATKPRPGEAPDYTLTVRLEHLYVTRQGAAPGRPPPRLVYGNAGLLVTLVEGRGREAFRDYASGASVLRADEPSAGDRARREALREALTELALRLGEALDRLGRGPSTYRGPARAEPPAVFLVERVSRTRTLLETLYVDAAVASVLRHEVRPLPDPSYGRPGEWLLARRTVEGLWLPEGPYQALARALDPRYDLRALDDAERYHFFGPHEEPPKPSAAEPRSHDGAPPGVEPRPHADAPPEAATPPRGKTPPEAATPATPPHKAPKRRPPKRRRPVRDDGPKPPLRPGRPEPLSQPPQS
jgi:hypothetical protein